MDGEAILTMWTNAMRAAGRSPRTIHERLRVVQASGLDPLTADVYDVEAWLATMGHLAPASRRDYQDALRALFKWMHQRGLREDNPTSDLMSIKVPRGEPRPITTEQLRTLLSRARRRRLRGYLLLGAYQGLRVSEIARVHSSDVDLSAGTIRVDGKGGTDCRLPVHHLVAEYAETAPQGWWFPSYSLPGPVTGGNVSRVISDHMQRCGIQATPHCLRHWHATELLSAGANLRVVQRSLRHANLQTTQIYTQVSTTQIHDALEALPDVA
jgi:site-specific recombinase XerD